MLNQTLNQALKQFQSIYQAVAQAKTESDALVAEGRRITGWPKSLSLHQQFVALRKASCGCAQPTQNITPKNLIYKN